MYGMRLYRHIDVYSSSSFVRSFSFLPLNILPTSFNCKMPHETNEYEDRFFSFSHALFHIDIKLCIYRERDDRLKIPIHAILREEKCQADGSVKREREDDLTMFLICSKFQRKKNFHTNYFSNHRLPSLILNNRLFE